MIAANFRKHPDAMALQFPLPFGTALVWALKRPGARILRKIRAQRAATFKAVGRIKPPVRTITPQWWKTARKAHKQLASIVKALCMGLTYAA
jgi:hypothetical protein